MIVYILDSSIAAKWYLPAAHEPLSAEAFRLLRDYEYAHVEFVVPDLFFVEFGSIFWKAVRRGRCDQAAASVAIEEILGKQLRTISSADLLEQAHQLACQYDRSIYDCVYIALAICERAHFVTADERLANAISGRLPVTWLGWF